MKRRLFNQSLIGLVGLAFGIRPKPDDVDRCHALAAKGPVRNESFRINRTVNLGAGYDIEGCDFIATEKLGKSCMVSIPAGFSGRQVGNTFRCSCPDQTHIKTLFYG